MSNISRRDFLKTAGVMTLAVAAAGVLAGCEGNKPAAPEAGKPEVKPSSVSFTGYTGDKLTVESVGRFNVYPHLEAKDPTESETVLKITYTKNNVAAAASIFEFEVSTQNLYKISNIKEELATADDAVATSETKVTYPTVNKVGLTAAKLGTDYGEFLKAGAKTTSYERYFVLQTTGIATDNLNVHVSYFNGEGKAEEVILPLSVTASDLF